MCDAKRQELKIYYFNSDAGTFSMNYSINAAEGLGNGEVIISGFLSDINNDDLNDIVVVLKDSNSKVTIRTWLQQKTGAFVRKKKSKKSKILIFHIFWTF